MAIIEFIQLGEYMKVSAIDEESGIEAVSILPLNLSRMEMQEAAMRRLQYVIKKKLGDNGGNTSGGFSV